MPNLEVYRIGYTIKGQSPTETELDATDLCQLIELFHTFLNENPGEKLEQVNYINCLRLPAKFPDSITQEQMCEYGYTWRGMIPLGATAAVQRWCDNHPVYALHKDDSESLIDSIEQFREHSANGGIFGYEAEETTIAFRFAARDLLSTHTPTNKENNNMENTLIDLLDDIQQSGTGFTEHEKHGVRLPDTVSNEDVAKHLIANGVTVKRWIPVTERYPAEDFSEGEEFNICTESWSWANSRREKEVQTAFWNGDYFYRSGSGRIAATVTHWQALPEPPKEED